MRLRMFNRHLGNTISSDSDLVCLVFQVFYSRYWGEIKEHDQGPQESLETRVDVVGIKKIKKITNINYLQCNKEWGEILKQ